MNIRSPRYRHILAATILALAGMCPSPVRSVADEPAAQPSSFSVTISVDASREIGPLQSAWRFFGADEPNYAYMKDGRELIGELGNLRPGSTYFRTHNLLTSGDGTPALKWGSTGAYREDKDGRPIYDWTIVDRIFDTYLEWGVKPYVQIGFMPKEFSVKPEPYQHQWGTGKGGGLFTGWAQPPKDYEKWGELVYQWTKHCVEKYGRTEVESWYWETWNEANIGYWQGTPADFQKLHDYAIAGVRRALPTARVGGPDTAGSGGQWTRDFLDHCLHGTNSATGKVGTPLDFVSFHAKGAPRFVDGHVRMGISEHLRGVDDGFRLVASFPELKGKPIVIGESDPEGCAACQGPERGYRNGTMYSSYTAASFARKYDLAERDGVNLEGVLTWAFEFEDKPFFAGFRVLATNGIDLPVLNVFRMFSMMGGRRLESKSTSEVSLDDILAHGVRDKPDVAARASVEGDTLAILAWHYHDDDVAGPDAEVTLDVKGLPAETGPVLMHHYRVDADHSNSYEAWKRMGSPQQPTPKEYADMERSSRLALLDSPIWIRPEKGTLRIRVTLPRQAVSLLRLELRPTTRRAQDVKATDLGDRPNPYPKCVRIFDGMTFDGWEADPSTWSLTDGAMRGSEGSSRLAYTKADYGNFRLIFTSRMAPVNGDHQGVLFWGDRPQDPARPKIDGAGWLQFMPPFGGMWDYHPPKYHDLPHETIAKVSRDSDQWHTTELLCDLGRGTMRAAVDGVEIVRYRHKEGSDNHRNRKSG